MSTSDDDFVLTEIDPRGEEITGWNNLAVAGRRAPELFVGAARGGRAVARGGGGAATTLAP